MAFLYEEDSFKRNLALKIADRYLDLTRDLHDELAIKIINRLGQQMKK